jgi:uncharacterized MAPEG superfamily protein
MSETKALIWSAALTWLMLVTASVLRSRGWTPGSVKIAFGNRDDLPEPTPLAGRADRAATNMLESLVLFTAAVVAVALADKTSTQTAVGAGIFFWARLAYWPCYLAGIIYLRTAIWVVSMIGLAMVAAAAI